MQFKSSKEFAEYIKVYEHEYPAEAEDLEERQEALKDRYAKEIKKGLNPARTFTPTKTMYQDVIESIIQDFYKTLPDNVRTNFSNRFYFTTIDNRRINASIRRSKDGKFYGVFLHSNLITAIHRLGKLEIAMFYPDAVHSCSRYPGQRVTRQQMIEIYSEVYSHFLDTKIPLGPQVLLEEPLNTIHLFKLKLQEQLIIFHEVAHFLNGDLEENHEIRPVIDIFPNASYQREHLADIIAYGLLVRQLQFEGALTIKLRYTVLLAIINLYKIQHIIQGVETETYPHPLNRMSVVIEKFYGTKAEEWVADAIINNKTDNLNLDAMPELVDIDITILKYIEQRLEKAFNPAKK